MARLSKPKKLDRQQLWDYALRALGQRAQSASEIRQKLARRAANLSDISDVMKSLQEYGIADDKNFSEAYAASRLRNQNFGRGRVLRDLRAKRVGAQVAQNAVEEVYKDSNEGELIEAYVARKYRNTDLSVFLSEQKHWASAYRRLRMAGFSSAGSIAALKKHVKPSEEWEIGEEEEQEN